MSDLAAEVVLDADVTECGDRVVGRAFWGPLDYEPNRVMVELRYWTEGRGDTDAKTVDELVLPGTPAGDATFDLGVPAEGPMSFDGALIRVLWEVRLRFDRSMRRDPAVSVPVTVLPRGGLAMWARQSGAPPV